MKLSGTSACFYLKAPSVTELSVEIEVHFRHQKSVLGSGEARGAAAVRSGHVAGSVEMPKVVMRCTSQKNGQSELLSRTNFPNPWKQSCYLFFHHRMWIHFWNVPAGMKKEARSHSDPEQHQEETWAEGSFWSYHHVELLTRFFRAAVINQTTAEDADLPSRLCWWHRWSSGWQWLHSWLQWATWAHCGDKREHQRWCNDIIASVHFRHSRDETPHEGILPPAAFSVCVCFSVVTSSNLGGAGY